MAMRAYADYRVRAVHCDHRASDEDVYSALKRATDPLDKSWARLRRAKTIAIKFNQDWPLENVVMHAGQRQQLVSDSVVRAVLRLLREKTGATLLCVDAGVHTREGKRTLAQVTTIDPVLKEFGVEYIDCNAAPVNWYAVPGGGLMFRSYPVAERLGRADAVVSVQKMKNHAFMGITLTLKNLFGLMPMEPHGRPRHYYHHLVRMPYMLADLGRLYDPALNILDALVCQAGEEWGAGQHPRVLDTLVAGDHPIATDACGAHLMGHDPESDWLTPPFYRDRNAILAAAEGGYGTVKLSEIDFQSEVKAPLAEFHAKITDPQDLVVSWRRTTAEQGLYYRDHKQEIVRQYAGEYILLQQGRVAWHNKIGHLDLSRRQLSGEHPEQAMWLKYVDPDEAEGEHYGVYEDTLRRFEAATSADRV